MSQMAEEARLRNLEHARKLVASASLDARFVRVKHHWLQEMMVELAR